MDWWILAMILLRVGLARVVPVGPAIHHFLDLVWHRFPDAFGHGFGINLGSLLDNFSIVFGIDPSILESEQFSIEFQLEISTLEHGKFEFYSIFSKKTEKWHVLILHAFRITLWIHFGIIFGTVWHEIPYFSAIVFPGVFLDVFLVAFWANLAPNASQNGSRISKKIRIVPFGRSRLHFGTILDPFRPPFDPFWKPFGMFWLSVGRHVA